MATLPGTKITAKFMPVADGSFPALYYGAGETGPSLASMNAGNSPMLFVGGGGVNMGFGNVLAAAGQAIGAYQSIQRHMADTAPVNGHLCQTFEDVNPIAAATVWNARVSGAKDYTGIAILDAFDDSLCPKGNSANRGMLYLAPPNGGDYSDKEKFLSDIAHTGTSAVKAVAAHNRWAEANAGNSIEAIRLCLYSSSIYVMDGVSKDDIAMAIYQGVLAAAQADETGLTEVQFPVGASAADPYFRSVQTFLSGQ